MIAIETYVFVSTRRTTTLCGSRRFDYNHNQRMPFSVFSSLCRFCIHINNVRWRNYMKGLSRVPDCHPCGCRIMLLLICSYSANGSHYCCDPRIITTSIYNSLFLIWSCLIDINKNRIFDGKMRQPRSLICAFVWLWRRSQKVIITALRPLESKINNKPNGHVVTQRLPLSNGKQHNETRFRQMQIKSMLRAAFIRWYHRNVETRRRVERTESLCALNCYYLFIQLLSILS